MVNLFFFFKAWPIKMDVSMVAKRVGRAFYSIASKRLFKKFLVEFTQLHRKPVSHQVVAQGRKLPKKSLVFWYQGVSEVCDPSVLTLCMPDSNQAKKGAGRGGGKKSFHDHCRK